MKILVNRRPVNGPWGGGNAWVQAFFKYAPEFGVTPVTSFSTRPDAVLIVDPRYDELRLSINEILAYRHLMPKIKIFQRINECDARKGTTDVDPLLQMCSSHLTHAFFVSNWTLGYHQSKVWNCSSNSVIYNGVDKDVFCPTPRTNKKISIVTHHWSDNEKKGQDAHAWLDQFVANNQDFTYTFIGRSKYQFKNSVHVQPLYGKELGDELTKHDVYVTATYADPGPNHVIESLSCRLPTYSWIAGGGAVEFTGKDHSYDDITELEKILLSKNYTQNTSFVPTDWRTCIESYVKTIIERV